MTRTYLSLLSHKNCSQVQTQVQKKPIGYTSVFHRRLIICCPHSDFNGDPIFFGLFCDYVIGTRHNQ